MKRLFIVVLSITMSGCALTDIAKDILSDWQDTNRYEVARETATNVCNQDILDRMDKFLGKEATAALKKKCDEKRKTPLPLN